MVLQEGTSAVVLVQDPDLALGQCICDVIVVDCQELAQLVGWTCGNPSDQRSLHYKYLNVRMYSVFRAHTP